MYALLCGLDFADSAETTAEHTTATAATANITIRCRIVVIMIVSPRKCGRATASRGRVDMLYCPEGRCGIVQAPRDCNKPDAMYACGLVTRQSRDRRRNRRNLALVAACFAKTSFERRASELSGLRASGKDSYDNRVHTIASRHPALRNPCHRAHCDLRKYR